MVGIYLPTTLVYPPPGYIPLLYTLPGTPTTVQHPATVPAPGAAPGDRALGSNPGIVLGRETLLRFGAKKCDVRCAVRAQDARAP